MRFRKKAFFIALILLTTSTTRSHGQTNEIATLLRDFEAKAAAGTSRAPEEAELAVERFEQVSREAVVEALPTIYQEVGSQYVSVRRVAVMALFATSLRPDGRALLSNQTAPLASLIIDSDIPIRRMTGLIIGGLLLNSSSPLLSDLESYLSRQDAVSTIGGGVAGLLMKAAPDDAASTSAVVQYMQRKDHTVVSRGELLQSVQVAGSHNRDIGKAVAAYAEDPNEGTSAHAIQTLQAMGKYVIADNRQTLLKIEADSRRNENVRAAATKALSVTQ